MLNFLNSFNSPNQIRQLGWLCLTIILGLGCKFYQGPGETWINQDLNGVFYVVCWGFLLAFLLPRYTALILSLSACLLTCGIEFLQLWQPEWLQAIRAQLVGRLILGSHFAWWDFPYYIVGGLASYVFLRGSMKGKSERS